MTGKELRKWRERHQLTQQQLAEKLQVAENTIYRWEVEARAIPPYLDLALKQLEQRAKK